MKVSGVGPCSARLLRLLVSDAFFGMVVVAVVNRANRRQLQDERRIKGSKEYFKRDVGVTVAECERFIGTARAIRLCAVPD